MKWYYLLIIIIGIYLLAKSRFTNILDTNYNNNGTDIPSCDYKQENRPYPSGKVPGSYLGLSQGEKDNLLIKFMEYNGSLSEFQAFQV